MSRPWSLSPDRYFSPNPSQRDVARRLYETVREFPIVSPHGHVDPGLLADPEARLGSPASLFIIPDHYVFRMLYSQGISLEALGIAPRDGEPAETDHRRIWQRFGEHFSLFRATPTGAWLKDELIDVFGIEEELNGENAQRIYDRLEEQLRQPAFTPRALFEHFNIEVLATTDPATSSLETHQALQCEGWTRKVRPTFRPDAVVNLATPGWHGNVERLGTLAGVDVVDYASFIRALEARRAAFKALGATATDQSATSPHTARLSPREADTLFTRALRGQADETDAARFTAHLLLEMARMSTEDGLVMQLHAGSLRNHNQLLATRFGPDMGADIPVQTEWTRNLQPLLREYGNDPRFRLILFTLDESSYGRELAPLAGHYPAILLGPPWWFFDSINGMRRYLDQVVETAGLANLAGFNDDTRAFASIPARHDMWRRVTCDWLAGLVASDLIDEAAAAEMAAELAYHRAKHAYRLE